MPLDLRISMNEFFISRQDCEVINQLKFEDNKEVATDQYGFQFVKNGIMIDTEKCRCLTCGTLTKYIEVCSEAHFCSDECVEKFYKQASEFEGIEINFEERLNRISTTYHITHDHAGCWLSNFEDNYICHKHNGACKNIDKCREIFKKESIQRL